MNMAKAKAKNKSKNKVLIVEDDSFISDMYKLKLEAEGFEVRLAEDGARGLEQINLERPDLVLLDVVMPRMDGFAVLAQVKGDPEIQNIPIVLLTNLGQKDSVEKGLKMGALDYIIKAHFTPAEVVGKVREILSK
jgi:DNA-binding response OmpR family regulator